MKMSQASAETVVVPVVLAVLPPFRSYYGRSVRVDPPIGVVLWAMVSDEVAARLSEGTTKLRPQDWKSGDKLWVVEVIAPFGGAEEIAV
jgi:cytolysin-activating lysine-acyltransferase